MTTDAKYPGPHYFCVDVETSDLRTHVGAVLSVGIVVMDADGNVVDTMYSRVRPTVPLHESWYKEHHAPLSDTQEWWRGQDQFVKDEAYADPSLHRYGPSAVGNQIRNLALTYGSSWEDRFFVADPSTFDRKWVDTLLEAAVAPDPFWYHDIDVWSMQLATQALSRRGANKGIIDPQHRNKSHKPDIPHHALADAFALAKDLGEFLKGDIIDLDTPHYEGWDEYQAMMAAEVEESSEEVEPIFDSEEWIEVEPEGED